MTDRASPATAGRDGGADVILGAVVAGTLVVIAGTIPRNLLFLANQRYLTGLPWAVPVVAAYLWLLWRWLNGAGPPRSSAAWRRDSLRARPVAMRAWVWALIAGVLGIVALVFALRAANRMVALPEQRLPEEFLRLPRVTAVVLLLAAAPIAGLVEEAAFRGYLQGPIERRFGLPLAILVSGTMFAIAHLDFTWILWPYYLAVAALYGVVTHLTRSILPAVTLHTGGNLYSNFDLLRHGRAEWQAAGPAALIWKTGADGSFWLASAACVVFAVAAFWALGRLGRVAKLSPT